MVNMAPQIFTTVTVPTLEELRSGPPTVSVRQRKFVWLASSPAHRCRRRRRGFRLLIFIS